MTDSSNRNPFLPKKFFLASGSAKSPISELNAFDEALKKSGIEHCNLVNVSSIIPKDAKEVRHIEIEPGTITHGVYARMDGLPGESIGAGIVWGRGKRYGIVAETHGYYKNKRSLEKGLGTKVRRMAKVREFGNLELNYLTEIMEVPKGYFGCTIAALVLITD
jgi:arginine decarboxylase